MASNSLRVVRRILQTYADRGVFRAFSEERTRSGKTEFKFLWLTPSPFILFFEPGRDALVFKNLLPNIPAKSSLYAEVRTFVKGWYSAERPAHRRINTRKIVAQCSNRGGRVSITFTILKKQYAYGVKNAVSLVHELYLSFLNVYHHDYMRANFSLPDE